LLPEPPVKGAIYLRRNVRDVRDRRPVNEWKYLRRSNRQTARMRIAVQIGQADEFRTAIEAGTVLVPQDGWSVD
jgi:hypothetical protein